MACILLTDMDSLTASPTAHPNGHLPDTDLAAGLCNKQDMEATCLTVQLYHGVKDEGGNGARGLENVLTFPSGEYVAEELCIIAAKASGE